MKTKNKKLFALLMLPAVIAMMVLPLCSFTTVQIPWDDDYYELTHSYSRYRSGTDINIGYTYNRGGNYKYDLYYGNIYDSHNVLVSSDATTLSSIRDSIKFYGCDYYMGDSNKSIDINSFSVSSLPSTFSTFYNPTLGEQLYLGLAYQSDNVNYSWLDGRFRFDDVNMNDNIVIEFYDYNYQPFDNSRDGWNLVTCLVTFYCQRWDENSRSFVAEEFEIGGNMLDLYGSGDFVSDTVYLDLNSLILEYLPYDDNFILGKDFLISCIDFELQHNPSYVIVEELERYYYKLGAIRVNSRIVVDDGFNTPLYGALEEFIGEGTYRKGYTEGYNAGLSNASSVWGNVGKFLTTTVDSFFSFELFDGFSLGGVMAIIVGAMLFIAFLKVFAGG